MILDRINTPSDVKKLNIKEKETLASEIREFLINNVSKTGGHLASNLGDVELTIAIHSVFNTPRDKIVWDVGHQTYTHKILTGRKKRFKTLRQFNGLSGFPKTSESKFDAFNTGHSSTSISAALGIARARDLKREKYRVVAVIGDGALTGGMALEALNDVGASDTNMIIILNDNEMSIDKNTGGLASALTKLRTKKAYTNSNKKIKKFTLGIPIVGVKIVKKVHRLKHRLKSLIIQDMWFEDIGIKYLGPVDGHDLDKLEAMLRRAKDLEGPVLIHVKTIKGKGYKPAEERPEKFHSVGKFDIETGKSKKASSKTYSSVFGDTLVEIARKNQKVIAITAAMCEGTGLEQYRKTFPKRFFDVEIAEQHAITMAAGLASNGCVPVVALYSSFLQRGYDQLIHDVCMQNLHVVFCIDRAGIVGNDGETHQGLLDLAFLRIVPNMTVMAPKNFKEFEKMLDFAINHMNKPVAIRYPRGGEGETKLGEASRIRRGKSELINPTIYTHRKEGGKEVKIVGIGKMVARAVEVAKILERDLPENYNIKVINARFLKPFDKSIVENCNAEKTIIATIEDGTLEGGLYTQVTEELEARREELLKNDKEVSSINKSNTINIIGFGYKDKFVKQGSIEQIEKQHKLDANSIAKEIIELAQ